MADEAPSAKRWLPLEANPDIMNQFCQSLGLGDAAAFYDVYGFDDDLLSMVPVPVLAVLFLYPINAESEAANQAQLERLNQEGQKVSEKLYFMRQTVGNACGTIGLLHAIGNNVFQINPAEGSYFKRFFEATAKLSPDERASYLENDRELEGAHGVAAAAGDTAPPEIGTPVDLHFICFVSVDGGLYELDGRKQQPVYHGVSFPESLLKDSVKVIQEFVSRNPHNLDEHMLDSKRYPFRKNIPVSVFAFHTLNAAQELGMAMVSVMTLLRLIALAAVVIVVAGTDWEPCKKHYNYQVKIKDVEVLPDPVVSGDNVTFIVPANTDTAISSGKVIITVSFHNIPVHREVDDLCEKTTCPIAPGDFVLQNSQALPGITPPGLYKIKMQMVGEGSSVLACAEIKFKIVWRSADQ